MVDGSVQFSSGLLTKGSALKSVSNMNFFSMLVAGIMPGESWRAALRNSPLTSTLKVGMSTEAGRTHPHLELPELTSLSGVGAYLLTIGTGTATDVAKTKIFEVATPYFRLTSGTLNSLRQVSASVSAPGINTLGVGESTRTAGGRIAN